jgi:ribulose kinase
MGHKWMWNPRWGGLPPENFLCRVDPLLTGVRERMVGRYLTSDHLAGRLTAMWAERLNLSPGIPIPVGGLDAHWDGSLPVIEGQSLSVGEPMQFGELLLKEPVEARMVHVERLQFVL